MSTSRRPLVLGAAVGYDWPKIRPFVTSLRRSAPSADIVLLIKPSRELTDAFAPYGVRGIPVRDPLRWLPPKIARQRFNRRRFAWFQRALMRTLSSVGGTTERRANLLARIGPFFHHPACSRYFYYLRFLNRHAAEYSHVLLTDVRDVLFQADPFAGASARGQVFLEPAATHGQDWGNDNWVDLGFGAEGKAAIAGKRVTCSGTTLAPVPIMLTYLRAMVIEIAERTHRFSGLDGVDQGVHNWLYWTGRLAEFDAVENFAGPILTMHGLAREQVRTTDRGDVVDPRGRVIPLLHQYDRHPDLASQLLRLVETAEPR